MGRVAVIAHTGKHLGGGLVELRQRLAEAGVADPLWYEVRKSRKAAKRARQAAEAGVDLVFVWGGDGMVQRCADGLAGRGVTLAVVPAGTANLLASALGLPRDVGRAVDVGLHGARRPIDVGVVNGERFVAMAGVGFDARMIGAVSGRRKRRWGRLSYVAAGARQLRGRAVPARVEVDGRLLHDGPTSCVLFGNIGTISGGLRVFPEARPDDGWLEVGVVTTEGVGRWLVVLARAALGRAATSRWVRMGRARLVDVSLQGELPFELDGGARPPAPRLQVSIEPGALTVCVPAGWAGREGRPEAGAGRAAWARRRWAPGRWDG
jgi:diacylglycerol kinase (ATP)